MLSKFFLSAVLSLVLVEARQRKTIKPEVMCEACQAMVWDVVDRVKKLPKSSVMGLDEQKMDIFEKVCSQMEDYAGKADIPRAEFEEACKVLMDKLEPDLEAKVNKKSQELDVRKKLCMHKKVRKVPACDKLWTEEQLPTNRKTPGARNLEAAERYLEANKGNAEVTTLSSGLQYKVITAGSGKISPKANEPVVCHYRGTLENGDEFDSSYARNQPAEFAPNQVIKAWTEALQLMVKGDVWELYVHPDLGYGAGGSPPKIGPNALLIFKIEVLGVKGKDDDATLKAQEEKASAEEAVPVSGEEKGEAKAEL